MKTKIAISLETDILNNVDRLSKGNRNQFIETLIRNSLNIKSLKTAVILAGGLGTRLRPLTYEIPKPLIPIKGRPILKWQIDLLKCFGIDDITVVLTHSVDKIKKQIGDEVAYITEKEPLGTGGALNKLRNTINNTFIVLNVDTLLSPKPNITGMYNFHQEKSTTATILVNLKQHAESYGAIKIADDNKVIDFMEKPDKSKASLISTGLYIFEPTIFDHLTKKCSLEKDVYPKLAKENKLYGYFFNGESYDAGTMEGYEKAIKEWRP